MQQTKLTPREMRRIAEHALGLSREMSLCFLEAHESDTGKAGWQLLERNDRRVKPGSAVIEPDFVPAEGRVPYGKPTSVTIVYGKNDTTRELVSEDCDAVFWSRSAMEKFVLDYYRPLKSPADFLALYSRVMGLVDDGTTLYAITHTYPSIETLVTEAAETRFLTDRGSLTESEFVALSAA